MGSRGLINVPPCLAVRNVGDGRSTDLPSLSNFGVRMPGAQFGFDLSNCVVGQFGVPILRALSAAPVSDHVGAIFGMRAPSKIAGGAVGLMPVQVTDVGLIGSGRCKECQRNHAVNLASASLVFSAQDDRSIASGVVLGFENPWLQSSKRVWTDAANAAEARHFVVPMERLVRNRTPHFGRSGRILTHRDFPPDVTGPGVGAPRPLSHAQFYHVSGGPMAKPTTTGKPAALPGRRVGIHRKAGTEAPAPGRQNTVAPGTARRPVRKG